MVCVTRRMTLMLLMLPAASVTHAADAPLPLSPAQIALFETPHLASIVSPVHLFYAFSREETGHPVIADEIWLDVRPAEGGGRHDVYPHFLTGERHINYPSALGFLGNPLIIFALDRDTRELSAATGGSPNWFRQRFRSALLDRATTEPGQVSAAGQAAPVEALTVSLAPFENEQRAQRFQNLRYTFILSNAVPGGVVKIQSIVPAGPHGPLIAESITYRGARAP